MKKVLRKTKIVGTIGPASQSEEMLTKLMNAGLNVTRINFSHGGYEENGEKIETIKKVRSALNRPVALLLDTKGPEIRTGVLETGNEKVTIEEGQEFTFVNDDIIGNNTKTSISYKELYKDVKVGGTLLVDDGALEFEITEIKGKDIVCKALNTGRLGSRKTMNVPGVKVDLPALTQKDIDDITEGIKRGFDYIAASFVRKASDVIALRNLLDSNGGERVKIISKIENQEGIDNFEEILELSDGIMVARGDMGVEIPMEQVPIVQKRFIKRCNQVGKPVITATQMLESMTSNPRPTRAEVSDVANAVYDTTGAIMLSGECAMGKYPVECVQAMSKISKAIEADTNYWKRFNKNATSADFNDIESHVAYTTCVTAQNMKAAGIVAYTHKGDSVRKLAGFGAGCPIFAITDDEKTFNQLSVSFNVVPVLVMGEKTIEDTICKGIEKIKADELVEAGDVLVISGGSKILPNASENKVFGGMVRI
ncbi:MAG TPA: pyruvate kinase [Clostridiaceae bacterium]|jgi:pyruvate kinase|nr:pyruvate kinase [Clostridiaceae bacterium]